jgi:hypothetical protein
MRGQGYDGAANMAGKFSGVRTRIQTEIPEDVTNTQRNLLCDRNISGLICNYTEAIS